MQYGENSYRPLAQGMGEAVAKRTVLRKKANGQLETWGDVADRVSLGNTLLDPRTQAEERRRLCAHIANGSILMSGRHLQHGDEKQPTRNLEVFTNCASAATSFLSYYLLLNGSGVGRSYDDDISIVDWSRMPYVHVVISDKHADYDYKTMESLHSFKHRCGDHITVHEVADSREGWAKALELIETMAFEGTHADEIVVFDFSKVRCKGSPIGGMQNRPSSGPVPTMEAIKKISTLKGTRVPLWKQAMYVDHYAAESVLVGGARRSARMAIKFWRDPGVLDFIRVKNNDLNPDQPFLWSANNSIGVDAEFWDTCMTSGTWANQVFEAIIENSYVQQNGEPGLINVDKLQCNKEGVTSLEDGLYAFSKRYRPSPEAIKLLGRLATVNLSCRYMMIPNPCGEVTLNRLGGYCEIGDNAPYFCDNMNEAEEAVRLTVRALMRTNTMDSVYHKEVERTNRVGVGLTGIHEWAWKMFGYGFRDLLDENKSKNFWMSLSRLARAVKDECQKYAASKGLAVPHTDTTIKPAGTTSKLFGLTEGANLPSMREYIRWVQFREDDPLVKKYEHKGYMVRRDLKSYRNMAIVGFPTQPEICKLGMGNKLVTAAEATPEEHYRWLSLLEKYWIVGVDEDGTPLPDTGNQISYTLKYKPDQITLERFKAIVMQYQPKIKCCSVMPQIADEELKYEYQPEQAVNLNDYNDYIKRLKHDMALEEDLDKVHLDCANGVCPVDFHKEKVGAGTVLVG